MYDANEWFPGRCTLLGARFDQNWFLVRVSLTTLRLQNKLTNIGITDNVRP